MRQSDDRVPEVVVAEAAPAGLAGANTGRSPRLKPYRRVDLARSQPTGASRSDRWRVRNSVAKMRSFLTLPRPDELGGPTDSRSCSTLMCPAAFWGWLSA